MKTATTVITVRNDNLEEAARQAGKFLREGKLVAFPTETVYGLGVDLENSEAVKRLYEVKGRPSEKSLTLAIAGPDDLKTRGVLLSPVAKRLADRFWPGPLTLILQLQNGETLGVRMPDHPVARKVIASSGVPIGLPSANPSGKTPPRSAEEVVAYFDGAIDLIVDGGKTVFGVSSTVVRVEGTSWSVEREGAIPKQEIERICRG